MTTGCFFFSNKATEMQCLSPCSLNTEVYNTWSYTSPLPRKSSCSGSALRISTTIHPQKDILTCVKRLEHEADPHPYKLPRLNACCYAVSRNVSGIQPQAGDTIFAFTTNKQSLCLYQFLCLLTSRVYSLII